MTGRRCPSCLTRLAEVPVPAGFPCAACRRQPPAFDRLLTGWFYEPPIREVVVGFKFHRLEYLGTALAEELAPRFAEELARCTVVTAVPLHWARWMRRGYNQAGLIARQMAIVLDRPYVVSLRRRLRTTPQTGLDRVERRANLRRAFAWRGRRVTGRPHWLLVDDVFTTGATLDRAARALKDAGVGRVTALVAAATPHPSTARPRRSVRNTPGESRGWF